MNNEKPTTKPTWVGPNGTRFWGSFTETKNETTETKNAAASEAVNTVAVEAPRIRTTFGGTQPA